MPLMDSEQLDQLAFGSGREPSYRPEIIRAIQEAYLPLRQAGYTATSARWAVAGFLANSWGSILRVEERVVAIAIALDDAETRVKDLTTF